MANKVTQVLLFPRECPLLVLYMIGKHLKPHYSHISLPRNTRKFVFIECFVCMEDYRETRNRISFKCGVLYIFNVHSWLKIGKLKTINCSL